MTETFMLTFPSAPAGHEIAMEFCDSMYKGRLHSFNQKSTYICRVSGLECFSNRFNYAS